MVSCGNEVSNDVTLNYVDVSNNNITYYIGDDIDFSDIELLLYYSDGSTKLVSASSEMISFENQQLFTQKGIHSVLITYENKECYLQVTVKERNIESGYMARFHSNSEEFDADPIIGNEITAFPIPTKKGYIFDGWYANIACDGEKCIAPYSITKNQDFYAKWIDERICTVLFYDSDYDPTLNTGTVLYREEVHYGEGIDLNDYEYPVELTGSTFQGWQVLTGSEKYITSSVLTIRAIVLANTCVVSIKYLDSSGAETTTDYTKEYGDVIDLTQYTIPKKDGHYSKWVVSYNHEEEYEDVTEDLFVLKESYTAIYPQFTIYTYSIFVQNGSSNQDDEQLKIGNVALADVYQDTELKKNIKVNWMGSFDFNKFDQEPYLVRPAVVVDSENINGFNSYWCFVIKDSLGNETWYDTSGSIYDEVTDTFIPQVFAQDEGPNYWTLKDANDVEIAKVINKKLERITADITIKAKYIKRSFDVTLRKIVNGVYINLSTFDVRYGVDFNPYSNVSYQYLYTSPSTNADVLSYKLDTFLSNKIQTFMFKDDENNETLGYEGIKTASIESLKQFYLTENTMYDIKQISTGIYSTVNEEITAEDYIVDDWSIRWYSDPSLQSEKELDFYIEGDAGKPGSIKANTFFYCSETDDRYYAVRFFDFSFSTFESTQIDVFYVKEDDLAQTTKVKEGSTQEVVYDLQYEQNGVQKSQTIRLNYYFIGWYTTPYELYLKSGYRGDRIENFGRRTSSQMYYAHYICNQTGSFNIIDTTQSIAYTGTAYTEQTVADGSISYTFPVGSVLVMEMIYKGITTGEGNVNVISNTIYQNYLKNYFYENYVNKAGSFYKQIVAQFDPSTQNISTAKTNITNIIAVINSIYNSYNDAVVEIYNHTYNGITINQEVKPFLYDDYYYLFNQLKSENTAVYESATSLQNLYEVKLTSNSAIRANMDNYGYSISLSNILGSFEDLINTYINELIFMYDDDTYSAPGYVEKDYVFGHLNDNITGFSGITRYLDTDINKSDNYKLSIIKYILTEYYDFLTEYQDGYTPRDVSDGGLYMNSKYNLNIAYGYDINADELKYEFSGWYKDSNYSDIYQSDFELVIPISGDIPTLYAKWTDITKGTEGLLYEEVTYKDGLVTKNGYVLVNLITQSEYSSEYDSENYYVTRNDANNIPTKIENNTLLQVPATIDKYLLQDNDVLAGLWNDESYKIYFIFDTNKGIYVQASKQFNSTQNYYVKEEYPVIGIASDVLINHANCISGISLPLNMYFIEEGAFMNCNIASISKAAPKGTEVELDYIIIGKDAADNNTALYQWLSCPYTQVIGKETGIIYNQENNPYTILSFAIGRETTYTSYSLLEKGGQKTQRIGKAAFMGMGLEAVLGTSDLIYIGDEAFSHSINFKQLGNVENKITFNSSLVIIGENAFSYTGIRNIEVESLSELSLIGANAFSRTNWLECQFGIRALEFNNSNGIDSLIILGYTTNIAESNFDHSGDNLVKYDEFGNVDVNGSYYGVSNNGTKYLINRQDSKDIIVIIEKHTQYISPNALEKSPFKVMRFNGFVEKMGYSSFMGCALSDMYINNTVGQNTIILEEGVFSSITYSSLTIHTEYVLDTSNWPEIYTDAQNGLRFDVSNP